MAKNNANKVSANANANKANASVKQIIADFAESTKGLLVTNLGTTKASIYKEELFSSCTEKEKKSLRKKFRNMLFTTAKSIISEKDKSKLEKLTKSFNTLYLQVYKVNDYSLQSVCNENLASEKKEILQKCLDICKGAK